MALTVLFAEVPCFYAVVERSRDPSLARRPVIVGGDPRKRGFVQSATPDAQADGVRPDMLVSEAIALCPRARLLRTNMGRYREVSRRMFACMRRSLARLEAYGLSGAYFVVHTDSAALPEIVSDLQERVKVAVGLSLRAGVASGKFLARLAAEEAGPEGLRIVAPGEEAAFLGPLGVERLEGVGKRTAETLEALGAQTIADVVALGRDGLQGALGVHGLRIHALARGHDDTVVRASRPKSISRESTLRGLGEGASGAGSSDIVVLSEILRDLTGELDAELQMEGLAAGKLILKVRFANQERTSRSETFGSPAGSASDLHECALRLLARTEAGSLTVLGLGVQLEKFDPVEDADRQLDLFSSQR